MKFQTKNLKFFILKYCHFSRLRVFCSMMHTLSKGQIKLWGHRVSFFCYQTKCVKNFYFNALKSHKIINFKCFSVKEYLHLVRSNKKLLYLKKCDHIISSLKKEYML